MGSNIPDYDKTDVKVHTFRCLWYLLCCQYDSVSKTYILHTSAYNDGLNSFKKSNSYNPIIYPRAICNDGLLVESENVS